MSKLRAPDEAGFQRRTTTKSAHQQKLVDLSIDDIAKASGVSVSTVSRILNNKPDVSDSTRERVLSVIRKKGYVPHPHAQRLASGNSDTIALVHPVISGEADDVLLDFILGASAVAEEQRFFFNLVTRSVSKHDLQSLYRNHYIDGVILMQICLSDWRVDYLSKTKLPFVMIGRTADCEDLPYVDLDFKRAVTMVLDHLSDLGHTKIAFLRHPSSLIEQGYGPAVRQLEGYSEYVRRRGFPELVKETDFSFGASLAATESLLEAEPELTAVISAAGDGMPGVVEAARRHGLRVPEDLSIACSSCSERIATSMLPALTSVNMESNLMGSAAAKMLIRLLKERLYVPEQKLLPPRFVVRDSTAPAAKGQNGNRRSP